MIRLSSVSLTYKTPEGNSYTALDAVDVTIEKGRFVCLLGPSGCGKTSLLNLIAGFLKPTTGNVFFDGRPVTGPGPDRGVVFQDPTLFPWLTVRRNVEFGLRQTGCPRELIGGRAASALVTVGLKEHQNSYPHVLSGGMRQRAAIARVLVLEPKALLADEPFSALDANARERLQDELLGIWEHDRRTLLYVTHSVEEAAYLADRVLIMGQPPRSIAHDIELPLPRPRRRLSAELQEAASSLRENLNRLPCCIRGAVEKKH